MRRKQEKKLEGSREKKEGREEKKGRSQSSQHII
jgi:hypothetical protein